MRIALNLLMAVAVTAALGFATAPAMADTDCPYQEDCPLAQTDNSDQPIDGCGDCPSGKTSKPEGACPSGKAAKPGCGDCPSGKAKPEGACPSGKAKPEGACPSGEEKGACPSGKAKGQGACPSDKAAAKDKDSCVSGGCAYCGSVKAVICNLLCESCQSACKEGKKDALCEPCKTLAKKIKTTAACAACANLQAAKPKVGACGKTCTEAECDKCEDGKEGAEKDKCDACPIKAVNKAIASCEECAKRIPADAKCNFCAAKKAVAANTFCCNGCKKHAAADANAAPCKGCVALRAKIEAITCKGCAKAKAKEAL